MCIRDRAMAEHARKRIAESNGAFAAVAGTFTNVVFAWVPPELRPLDLSPDLMHTLSPDTHRRLHELAPAIKAQMQQHGTAMVGFQPIAGLNTFRLLFMNPKVTTGDVDSILDRIDEYGSAVVSST